MKTGTRRVRRRVIPLGSGLAPDVRALLACERTAVAVPPATRARVLARARASAGERQSPGEVP